MRSKREFHIRNILVIAMLSLIQVFFGQACGENYSFSLLEEKSATFASNNQGTSGNGGTYDGKLVFLHLEPDFTCEGKSAPKAILSRNESNQWFLTVNTREQCASVSLAPVFDVNYAAGSTALIYQDSSFTYDAQLPDAASGLPNYPIQFKVSASADPNSSDLVPADDICAEVTGLCSLKAAVEEVNSKPSRPAIIVVEAGTYKLNQGLNILSQSVVLVQGDSPSTTILDGQNLTNILRISGDGTGYTTDQGVTTVENLTFVNGKTTQSLTGAALTNYASLSVRNSIFSNNNSNLHGAIYSGSTKIRGSILIENSQINSNPSRYGVDIEGASHVTVSRTTFASNATMVALRIAKRSTNVLVQESLLSNNSVGIFLDECLGTCRVENSTIVDNTNVGLQIRGPFDQSGNYDLLNNTVFHNGLASNLYSNISFDSPGATASTLNLVNTIVASGGSSRPNCKLLGNAPVTTVASHVLSDDSTCLLSGANNIVVADPMLLPLADNGGPTLTMLPMGSSPALDSGRNDVCPVRDQRGSARPANLTCDIGSVEIQ